MKPVKLKGHVATKYAEFKNNTTALFLNETEKPLPAESVDRTTHNSTKKDTVSII
jgi:hypothetical protein